MQTRLKMPTWIDENLAIAPMPSEDQIPELAKTFKAVVILVEDQELDYDIHQWGKFGVKVKHMPIPDFGTPGLNDLHEVIEWINREIEDGKVLVHCLGGIGRSGMVATAYLISKGFSVNEAIKHVRARVPGAIETCEQEELSRRFARGYE